MKTAEQIAQWVIDNRYPKNENNKVSDSEMYYELVESIAKLCAIPHVVGRSEQLKADLYKFRDMWCQNVDISTIDEYVDELGF